MSKQIRQTLPTTSPESRPGEGTLVNVIVDQFEAADGSKVANLGINLNFAPVPDRKYVADACAVKSALGTVKLMFGQERVGQTGWRSLVLVQMSVEAAGRFLGSLQQPGGALNMPNPIVAKYGPESLTSDVVEPEGPGSAITLGANLVAVSISENEACLDFYQASPFSMVMAIQSSKLALEPVVRIDLRASLFLALAAGITAIGIEPQELKARG